MSSSDKGGQEERSSLPNVLKQTGKPEEMKAGKYVLGNLKHFQQFSSGSSVVLAKAIPAFPSCNKKRRIWRLGERRIQLDELDC